MCFDGVKRLCHIRGNLRKKVWINQSDIILVGLRDYQDAKPEVIGRRGEEPEVLRRVPGVRQDQRDGGLRRRRHRRDLGSEAAGFPVFPAGNPPYLSISCLDT